MEADMKFLLNDLKKTYFDMGETNMQISILHALVDREEINCAEKNYRTATISTDDIRMIFRWVQNSEVIRIREAKEAEKKNENVAERTEG